MNGYSVRKKTKGGEKMIDDLLRIIDDNNEDIVDQVTKGFNVVKKLGRFMTNRQCYILTPISTLLAKSGYGVYTHILGAYLPKLPTKISEEVKSIVSWCKSPPCAPKFTDRCLNKATSSEIDALVLSDADICAIEHASEIGALCWDMVKLYKLVTSRKGISACLFLTWYDVKSDEHSRFAETLLRLGKMLFDNSIGKEKWAVIYIPYSIEKSTLNVFNLVFP